LPAGQALKEAIDDVIVNLKYISTNLFSLVSPSLPYYIYLFLSHPFLLSLLPSLPPSFPLRPEADVYTKPEHKEWVKEYFTGREERREGGREGGMKVGEEANTVEKG